MTKPLSINSIEDLENETPELIAPRLDGTAEKAHSQVSRTQSAIVKNWRPKSSKGYGSRNEGHNKTAGKTVDREGVEETRDTDAASDVKSRTAKSKASRATDAKSYISNLEQNLKHEREARKQLESEINEIKKMN